MSPKTDSSAQSLQKLLTRTRRAHAQLVAVARRAEVSATALGAAARQLEQLIAADPTVATTPPSKRKTAVTSKSTSSIGPPPVA